MIHYMKLSIYNNNNLVEFGIVPYPIIRRLRLRRDSYLYTLSKIIKIYSLVHV